MSILFVLLVREYVSVRIAYARHPEQAAGTKAEAEQGAGAARGFAGGAFYRKLWIWELLLTCQPLREAFHSFTSLMDSEHPMKFKRLKPSITMIWLKS